MTDFEQIFEALATAQVRFVVVGGIAVVLQGHLRMTADVDLVVALDHDNALAAIRALTSLGYKPRAPVRAEDFADAEMRRGWMEDKGMQAFSLWSARLPATEVDLFVSEPVPFDALSTRAASVRVGSLNVAVASIADLITMKELAGRPKDLLDVTALRRILSERERDGA